MKKDNFTQMLDLCRRLDDKGIAYHLEHSRYDALMIFIDVPGERWEVEFLENGDIEVERFVSDGEIGDESWVENFFARFSEPAVNGKPAKPTRKPAVKAVKNHAVRSRK